MLKKILSPFKSPSTNLIFALCMTWLYVIVVLFITVPLITLSEATTPETWKTILHFALMTPGLAYFMFSTSEHFQHIKSLRFLLFPLMLFSIPAWGILTLLGIGGAVLWFTFFLFPVWIFGIPGTLIFGLILDLKKKN